MKKNTRIINAGRRRAHTGSAVNPALVRASTIVFDSVAQMREAAKGRDDGVAYYGRRGTATTFAFREAMCELEGAEGCYVYPCGTAAITSSFLALLTSGDHVLVVDSVYDPTREFVDGVLARLGVEADYYDPLLTPEELEKQLKPNSKLIYMESPGSLTMEVQDVPGLARLAQKHGLISVIDNTFATPLNFRPLQHGVDISIHSATKYMSGHSDVMLGVASANAKVWPQLQHFSYQLGQCASPDDIYTTLRGLRTLPVRMRQHAQSSLCVARWLAEHECVDHVRHPAFSSCPGHAFYERDFDGGNGLFSLVLNTFNTSAMNAMLDSFQYFKMGFSWGGYESLVLGYTDVSALRTATQWQASGHLIRLHVGLEDTEDLIDDLRRGLAIFKEHLI